MKKLIFLFLLGCATICCPQRGLAQGFNDLEFPSLQCLPAECEDELELTVSGIALVIANAQCNNGVALHRQGSVNIGTPIPCILPLSARVLFQHVTDPIPDPDGCDTDFVDSMVGSFEVEDFFLDVVMTGDSDDDCLGGQGAEVKGVIPCGFIDD